jgi:hypothetical protein
MFVFLIEEHIGTDNLHTILIELLLCLLCFECICIIDIDRDDVFLVLFIHVAAVVSFFDCVYFYEVLFSPFGKSI